MPTEDELNDLFENDEISTRTAVRLVLSNQQIMAAKLDRINENLHHYPSLTWLLVNRTRPTLFAIALFFLLMWLLFGEGGQAAVRLLITAATGLPAP